MHLPSDPALSNLLQKANISLTADQASAMDVFVKFLDDDRPYCAMVLRGAAGTGKTFLLDLISRLLKRNNWKSYLMAPTGRAAKVMTRRTKKYASTLHRHIYTPVEGPHGIYFELRENRDEEKVCYIVDEASMLGAKGEGAQKEGGGGNLLNDLIDFAYQDSGRRKIIFCGDPAQLPPVGHNTSPALSSEFLVKQFRMNVQEANLNEIMRQAAHSEILVCAAEVRNTLGSASEMPVLDSPFGQDVVKLDNPEEAMEIYTSLFDTHDPDKVVIITYSNFYAAKINHAIRGRLFETEEPLVRGERLMVVRNNYSHKEENFPFIANGEPGTVTEVYTETFEEKYGLKWMDAEVEFQGMDEREIQIRCKIILDLLGSKQPQLSFPEFQKVITGRKIDWEIERQEGLAAAIPDDKTNKKSGGMKKDPFLTALQVKYGYAVTGHKAQGGQWKTVIVAFEPLYPGVELQDYLRWTYTALTRAEEKLYLLGWPFGQKD